MVWLLKKEQRFNLFAEKGFDGARVDKLAEMAKVNKALIYYYFKSKEAIPDMSWYTVKDKIAFWICMIFMYLFMIVLGCYWI